MLNNVVIMGRICNDLELRKTSSDVSKCRFTVAVDRRYTKPGEEKQTDFIDVLAWRNTAEFVSKYFRKGEMIAIQGAIQTGSYEKDGIKRKTFEIVADNVSFCGSKNDNNTTTAPTFATPTPADFSVVVDDGDLPF